MLSFVPLAMLLVGAFGLFFEDEEIRRRVVEAVFENVPLSQEEDRARLERTVDDALDNTGRLGPISVLLLIVSGSGVMGAMRHAINQAWDIEARPSILKRKALDLSLMLGAALVLIFSVALSGTRRVADWLGDAGWTVDLVGDLLPFVFTVAVVLFLYRVLPVAAAEGARDLAGSGRRGRADQPHARRARALFRVPGRPRRALRLARRADGAADLRLRRVADPGLRRRVRVGVVAAPR